VHRVEIKLGSSYPRTIPELRWITPIYHPNISEIGMVCLGGYGTHWVPSVQLDELCVMLWDMARYHNYDIRSPYNRDAALWVANQTAILFPTDPRPLRDVRAALGRIEPADQSGGPGSARDHARSTNGNPRRLEHSESNGASNPAARVRKFIERYRRGFTPATRSVNASLDSSPEPANSELQALASAVAASTPSPGGEEASQELLILDSDDPVAPPPRSQPPADEIVYIE
jgi:hypothetical protein